MLNASLTPDLYTLYWELKTLPFATHEVEFSFAKRLATENAWPQGYADRVLEEYLRFLLLTQVADFSLSPSDPVDQAWHLHMLYSRSYWDVLCAQVLKKPLHHDPVEAGGQNRELLISQYTRTLERYEALFGETPPKDIWPTAEERFASKTRFQRVDTSHLQGEQIPPHPWKRGLLLGLFSLLMAGLTGLMFVLISWLDTPVIMFVGIMLILALFNVGTIHGSSDNTNHKTSGGGTDGGGCSGGGCGGGCGG